jgi:hypothetical protein
MQTLSKTSVVVLSLMVFILAGGLVLASEPVTGSYWYAVDHITKADKGSEIVVWATLPAAWHGQEVKITEIVPEPVAILEDERSGNRIIEWRKTFEDGQPPLNAFFHYNFELTEKTVGFKVDPTNIKPYNRKSDLYQTYTAGEKGIQIDGRIQDLAREVVGDNTSPYLQAEAIYTWIMHSLEFVPGGFGDRNAKATLEERKGDCGQFSTLFVGMCRSLGIPARTVTNAWASGGRHVFAEFYLPEYGWVPSDPSQGQMLLPNHGGMTEQEVANFLGEKGVPLDDPMWLFGNLFSDRIITTLGNNIRFQSPTMGKLVSFQRMFPGGDQALPGAFKITGFNDDIIHGGFFVFGDPLPDDEAAHALTHQHLASSFFKVGLHEMVEDGCRKSLDAGGGGIQGWINMGKVYMHKGEYYKAEAAFKRSMNAVADRRNEKLESLIWSHNYLGNCYDMLGHRDMAIEEYQHVVDMGNDFRGAVGYAKQYLKVPFSK